jgi:hypothetical protein
MALRACSAKTPPSAITTRSKSSGAPPGGVTLAPRPPGCVWTPSTAVPKRACRPGPERLGASAHAAMNAACRGATSAP